MMFAEANPANPWLNPGTFIGIAGFLFGVFSFLWNRRYSSMAALSSVLKPMIHAAQHLHMANGARMRAERLKLSFPNAQPETEAAKQVNNLIGKYNEHLNTSQTDFRTAESELASSSFRFPDRISRLARTALSSLSEFARVVGEGFFDKAELQYAQFRDDYNQLTAVCRGWRWHDPISAIRSWFSKKDTTVEEDDEELSKEQCDRVIEIVHKRMSAQIYNDFAIHPPKKLIDDPELAKSDSVIDELDDSIFVVAFQDGSSYMLTFPEFAFLLYNLVAATFALEDANRMIESGRFQPAERMQISFKAPVSEIMRPETIKALLSTVTFESTASDAG